MPFLPFKRELQTQLQNHGHVTFSGLWFSMKNPMLKVSNVQSAIL